MEFKINQCIASRVRRLSRVIDGYLREILKGFDITENQMNILFALKGLGEIEQGVLGKKLKLERSTVSRAVRLLENKGYLIKTKNYQPEIKLTRKGEQLVSEMLPEWNKFMNDICLKIGEEGFEKIKYLEDNLL